MGMYTGLRGEIRIKPEYVDKISNITKWNYTWEDQFADLAKENILVDSFVNKERARQIPNGALCYMPADWGTVGYAYITENNMLSFACSLKNYDHEISSFIAMLPVIAEAWHLEELYEEFEEPTLHSFGKVR